MAGFLIETLRRPLPPYGNRIYGVRCIKAIACDQVLRGNLFVVLVERDGSNLISEPSGQLLPVIDIVETLPTKLNPGDRYLVGSGSSYSIVTVDVDHFAENNLSTRSEAFTNNSGKSVRVINQKSMAYQLVDGELVTYDQVNGGTFN
jgi:hypothetical protein